MTDDQKKKYLKSGGIHCPHCNSENLNTGHMNTDAGCAWQAVTCENCGEEWIDEYDLTGIRDQD